MDCDVSGYHELPSEFEHSQFFDSRVLAGFFFSSMFVSITEKKMGLRGRYVEFATALLLMRGKIRLAVKCRKPFEPTIKEISLGATGVASYHRGEALKPDKRV